MKLALVPGFNVSDGGAATVGQLKPQLEAAGHESVVIDYGHYNIFEVHFKKHEAVRLIVDQVLMHDVDAVVGHSNGCNFQDMALRFIAQHSDKVFKEVRIAPALNRNIDCADNVSNCTVFHSRSDFWVWVSGFIPFSRWGRQGQKGYKGSNKKMRNWPFTDLIPDHSDYFKDGAVKITAAKTIAAIK